MVAGAECSPVHLRAIVTARVRMGHEWRTAASAADKNGNLALQLEASGAEVESMLERFGDLKHTLGSAVELFGGFICQIGHDDSDRKVLAALRFKQHPKSVLGKRRKIGTCFLVQAAWIALSALMPVSKKAQTMAPTMAARAAPPIKESEPHVLAAISAHTRRCPCERRVRRKEQRNL